MPAPAGLANFFVGCNFEKTPRWLKCKLPSQLRCIRKGEGFPWSNDDFLGSADSDGQFPLYLALGIPAQRDHQLPSGLRRSDEPKCGHQDPRARRMNGPGQNSDVTAASPRGQ